MEFLRQLYKDDFERNMQLYSPEILDFISIIYIKKSEHDFKRVEELLVHLMTKFETGNGKIEISDIIDKMDIDSLIDKNIWPTSYFSQKNGNFQEVRDPLKILLKKLFVGKTVASAEIFQKNIVLFSAILVDLYTMHLSWTRSFIKIKNGDIAELYSRLFDKINNDNDIDCGLYPSFNRAFTYCIKIPQIPRQYFNGDFMVNQAMDTSFDSIKNSIKISIGDVLTNFLKLDGTRNKLFEMVRYLSVFFTGQPRIECFSSSIGDVHENIKADMKITRFDTTIITINMNIILYQIMTYMCDVTKSHNFNITVSEYKFEKYEDATDADYDEFFDQYHQHCEYFQSILNLIINSDHNGGGGTRKLEKIYLPSCKCKDGRTRIPFRIKGYGNTIFVMKNKKVVKKSTIVK